MQSDDSHKFILLGASRGLGWATYLQLGQAYPKSKFVLVARKMSKRRPDLPSDLARNTEIFDIDFTKSEALDQMMALVTEHQPTTLIYFAAGGPFGTFQTKKWADHQWAMDVSFLFPARLIHSLMNQPELKLKNLICIGSAIAENQPDPGAASYCAAKHALAGLIQTLQKENTSPFQIQLFSPGYMKTDLLPENSWPRKQGLAEPAEIVAQSLISKCIH